MKKLLLLMGLACAMIVGAGTMEDDIIIPEVMKVDINYSGLVYVVYQGYFYFSGSLSSVIDKKAVTETYNANKNNYSLTFTDGTPIKQQFSISLEGFPFFITSENFYTNPSIPDDNWYGYDWNGGNIKIGITDRGEWRLYDANFPWIQPFHSTPGSLDMVGDLIDRKRYGLNNDLLTNSMREGDDALEFGRDFLYQCLNSFPKQSNFLNFDITGYSEIIVQTWVLEGIYHNHIREFSISVKPATEVETILPHKADTKESSEISETPTEDN